MTRPFDPFVPPPLLRSPHLQSILSSAGPRKKSLSVKAANLTRQAKPIQIPCRDGVKLQGYFTPSPLAQRNTDHRGLVILIHGWEGCSESLYNLATGQHLLQQGYDIFRLNMRDHGGTTHLNRLPFTSTRLGEVLEAVKFAQDQFAKGPTFLCGFSLGGNFALRIAANAQQENLQLTKVIAVCPVLDALKTMQTLEEGFWLYHDYYVRRWKNTLRKKLDHYPDLNYQDTLLKAKTLREMMIHFAPICTNYPSATFYLRGYSLIGDRLKQLTAPCHIISAKDDPIIEWCDLEQLAPSNQLTIELQDHGGHCAFLQDYRLNSWLDQRIAQLLADAAT